MGKYQANHSCAHAWLLVFPLLTGFHFRKYKSSLENIAGEYKQKIIAGMARIGHFLPGENKSRINSSVHNCSLHHDPVEMLFSRWTRDSR